MVDSILPTDTDLYLVLCPDGDENLLLNDIPIEEIPEGFLAPNKSKLLYDINRLTNIYHFYILPFSMALDILAIAYKEGHL